MKISIQNQLNFKRKLKASEENEYRKILKEAGKKAAHGDVRSILIIPATSLPQTLQNNTGVGNLGTKDAEKFFDFAQKYWGINEIQILPMGQYHPFEGGYPIYSGTSMNLGNHVINLKSCLSDTEFNNIVSSNKISNRVNFSNIIDYNSPAETALKKLYNNLNTEEKNNFLKFKILNYDLLEKKGLYTALQELNNSYDYKNWNFTDKNLFNEDIINSSIREKRIKEIKKLKADTIDFYIFKNYLAEKSLSKAKEKLNNKGIKLCGDMLFGFSFDEVWANPKAFIPNLKITEWGSPVLDIQSKQAEELMRKRTQIYAKLYDSFRVDAAWAYITPNVTNIDNNMNNKLNNGTKFLDIIDEEVIKLNKDKNSVIYEFAADGQKQFNIFEGSNLKPCVKDRIKVYTSDYLSDNWGSADNFIKRGWDENKFIIGAANHDSDKINPTKTQINALSNILKIPKNKLSSTKEFLQAKFAEPLRAKNNMIFFIPALGLDSKFQNNQNYQLNFTTKIPENYEKFYFKALTNKNAYNPMDGLEKQFIAQGLDKTEPKLFKKIIKYRKILEEKEKTVSITRICIGTAIICAAIYGLYILYKNSNFNNAK